MTYRQTKPIRRTFTYHWCGAGTHTRHFPARTLPDDTLEDLP